MMIVYYDANLRQQRQHWKQFLSFNRTILCKTARRYLLQVHLSATCTTKQKENICGPDVTEHQQKYKMLKSLGGRHIMYNLKAFCSLFVLVDCGLSKVIIYLKRTLWSCTELINGRNSMCKLSESHRCSI